MKADNQAGRPQQSSPRQKENDQGTGRIDDGKAKRGGNPPFWITAEHLDLFIMHLPVVTPG
jgi:hypothetical protein